MNKLKFLFLLTLIVILPLSAENNAISVYFTNPMDNSRVPAPKKAIIEIINNSTKSFYSAIYDLTEPDIVDAIVNAKKRGVDVRLVTDRTNAVKKGMEPVINAGVPVVTNNGRGLMHNKFAIIDGSTVWTGSYNFTQNCTFKNNNNALKINSEELADIYLAKFNDMFEHGIFSSSRKAGPFSQLANKYYVKIGDTDINVHFSPGNNVERILAGRIEKAEKSIHFMAFSFTSDPLGEAMIKKFKSGVKVFGLFEKKETKKKESEYHKMKLEGIPVKLDRTKGNMHHKVIIIDEEIVITGSYNFSKNANKVNDENTIIIADREIAAQYLKEFYRLY
jgi:phosphatidylserine/phosphatidylglycerophosphate/cardiolipin synthase-like enzyme